MDEQRALLQVERRAKAYPSRRAADDVSACLGALHARREVKRFSRVAHKTAKYNAAWDLHGNVTLVVAAIETGGRWSPGFTDYLKTYIKAAHPDDTKAFVFQLKAAAQRVSVALQRSTALAILEMNRRAKTYPSLKV